MHQTTQRQKIMSSILGLDYGAKRVGVAIAHRGVNIASPLKTIENSGSLIDDLVNIAAQEKARLFVVGLPRNLDGDDTEQTRVVRRFADSLKDAGFDVALQDEAATTVVIDSNDKSTVDARAASLILSDYLTETERASNLQI